jgi:DNA polymerase III psi subunit
MMLRAGTRRSLANAMARLQLKALRRLIAVAEQAIEMASPLVKDWRSRTKELLRRMG